MRSTAEVITHHLTCFASRDIDGLLADYSDDALFFSAAGALRGPGAIRTVFQALFREFAKPGASVASSARLIEGDYAYLAWTAETADNSYELASDALVVRDGRIRMQAFTAKTQPKHDNGSQPTHEAAVGHISVTGQGASAATIDMKLEVVVIPISDFDRSREFYLKLGWREDLTPPGKAQFTPPGSACSIQFDPKLTSAAPGSARNYLIVSDVEAARDKLVGASIEVSDVFHAGPGGMVSGPDPERRSYRSFTSFSDPDGNSWLLQEVTTRLPGRIDSAATSFGSASDLASALRRAEAAHGRHEARTGQADRNWPDWCADYMAREQSGEELPQ